METQTNEMNVDMYDVIFKTIYLFLETNEFHETAATFLTEIRQKFHREIDTTKTNAKTLILRPFLEAVDVATTKRQAANQPPRRRQQIDDFNNLHATTTLATVSQVARLSNNLPTTTIPKLPTIPNTANTPITTAIKPIKSTKSNDSQTKKALPLPVLSITQSGHFDLPSDTCPYATYAICETSDNFINGTGKSIKSLELSQEHNLKDQKKEGEVFHHLKEKQIGKTEDIIRRSWENIGNDQQKLNLEENKQIKIEVLSPKSSQLINIMSHKSTNISLSSKMSEKDELLSNYFENSKDNRCADCIAISQIKEILQTATNNQERNQDAILDQNTTKLVHQSFKLLQELQENHLTLIHLALEITNAIWNISNESRDLLFSQYHQQIYNFYSYPGTHCTTDVVLLQQNGDYLDNLHDLQANNNNRMCFNLEQIILDDVDDRTDYQIESSVINSSNESNKIISARQNDTYIPLESKPVVGDIPGLICDRDLFELSPNLNSGETILVSNVSNLSNLSKLSKMSKRKIIPSVSNEDLSNDDNDRRSPSRFGSEFNLNLKLTEHGDKNKSKEKGYSGHRVNKSATVPSVQVENAATSIAGNSKSRSASYLQDKTLYKNLHTLSPRINNNQVNKTTNSRNVSPRRSPSQSPSPSTSPSRHTKRNQSPFEVKKQSRTPRTSRNASPRTKKTPKQSDSNQTQNITLNYQAMIKEKTKLILERQKSMRLETEQKKSQKITKSKKNINENKSKAKNEITKPQKEMAFVIQDDGDSNDSENCELLKDNEFVTNLQTKTRNQNTTTNKVTNENKFEGYYPGPYELDWSSLKRALFEGTPEMKMKLMQALRWRLIDCEPPQREQHLLNYVKNDILSINTIPPYGQLFLESFYCPKKIVTPHPLQEEMARVINTLASLAMGRLYLERDENLLSVMLLPLLMGKLPGIKIFDLTREFTMATVQKLSLSNKMREVIISAGTMEWLITFVEKNHQRMSTYEAEYSTALLTNLSINKEARNRCERIADRVVAVIDELIDTPHQCCLPYINPILYSLLLNPVINDRAVSRGIGVRLKKLFKVYGKDADLKRQLEAIILMHETRDFCACDDADTEDMNNVSYQNYADYLEPELSQRDPIYHTPIGEELLKLFYTSVPSNGNYVKLYKKEEARSKHPTIVQKNCVCNNKSLLRLEQRLLAEEAQKQQMRVNKLNKWQNRPTNHNTNPPNINNHHYKVINKPKTTIKVRNEKNKHATSVRQRSFSQPPAIKRIPPTPKNNFDNYMNKLDKIDQQHEQLEKIERIKMAPLTTAPPIHLNHTQKEFIVNCCYKMDYVNAVAAPPGEYLPQALHTTRTSRTSSSPNLQNDSQHDDSISLDNEKCEMRKKCSCYSDMQHFCSIIGDFKQEQLQNGGLNASQSTISTKSLKSTKPPSLFRRKSTDSSPNMSMHHFDKGDKSSLCVACEKCKNSLPIFDFQQITDDEIEIVKHKNGGDNKLESFPSKSNENFNKVGRTSKTKSRMQLGEYHVVSGHFEKD